MEQPLYKPFGILANLLLVLVLFSSHQLKTSDISFTIKNNLNIDRTAETVTIPIKEIKELAQTFGAHHLLIKEVATNKLLVSQVIDINGDGAADEIIFQTNIKARTEKKYTLSGVKNGSALRPKSNLTTYSRFVPERTDDYTWENDRVAFRTYGPVAQQMVEQGKPGGTLTSGIDAWLKRVSYPIINKWYQHNLAQGGYYHIDHGEGYDPYHVGASRGLGGIGILINDSLYVSKNFISYRKLADGPIRTLFELTYAPWSANGNTISEKKTISLDLGSNLTRFEVTLAGSEALPNATIGITLHEKKGEVQANPENGWFRYWEPMDDAFLGTGIVLLTTLIKDYKDHRVKVKDQSHLYVITKPENNALIYYAGFGWSKSGQFKNQTEWDAYLNQFSQCLASPLELKIF